MVAHSASSDQRMGQRTQLPLIFCPDCRWRKVELVLHTSGNPDKVFFTCLNQKKEKPGCEFYLWEADYVEYLRMNHGYRGHVGQHGGGDRAALVHTRLGDKEQGLLNCIRAGGHEAKDGPSTQVGDIVKEEELVANAQKPFLLTAKDMCVLVKVLIATSVCVLVAMICNLVAFLLK